MPTTQRPARIDRTERPPTRSDATHPPGDPPRLGHDEPRRPAGTYETSVYRLDRVNPTASLRDALDREYLRDHDLQIQECQVQDTPALLVHGTTPRERAEWCDILAGLTGEPVTLGYSSAGGGLLIAVNDTVYALTYGHTGRHMINLELADPGFGVGFAVRSLSPDQIKLVRRRVFGTTGRIDRNFVPGGQHIRMYGIDKWGEIVGQVSGRTNNPALTACRTGKSTPVVGGDSLHIHLGTDPADLLADLREIDRVYHDDQPDPDLEFITQIRPIRPGDPRLPELEERLDDLLGMPNPPDIGLAVPGRLVGEIEHVRSFQVRVPRSGLRPTHPAELTLDDVLEHTNQVPSGYRCSSLGSGRITMYADYTGTEAVGSAPASRWITAQLPHGASHLLLQEGGWFEIGHKHLEYLREEIAQILAKPASITLPAWTSDIDDEDDYNARAAKTNPDLVLLHQALLKTTQHRRGRGIEACDLLGPDLELIHVKRAGSSSPLSHLFTQGIVSVDALKYEADARQLLVDHVQAERPDHPISLGFTPRKVIYAIALDRGRQLTADTLFTFAQVALYRAVKTLRQEDVEVEVIAIPTT